MSETVKPWKRRLAPFAEHGANALCISRIVVAPFIAEHAINHPEPRTWAFAGAVALIGATDKLDGWMGRWAARVRATPTKKFGAWIDQVSDKIYVHAALGGIAASAIMDGQPALGSICIANQAVVLARDAWVTRERKLAEADGADTKAKFLGKLKTAAQIGMVSIGVSPLVESTGGQLFIAGGITATTGLAIVSGVSLVNGLRSNAQVETIPPIAEASAA